MKQLVISDIDFVNPDKDQTYSKNIIGNLLGNYYFSSKDKKYLWSPKNLNASNKASLIDSEDDTLISEAIQGNKEIITLMFKLDEWNKSSPTQEEINTLTDKINKYLSSSYYYGLADKKNPLINPNSIEEKLFKQYGEYFYDYSMVLPTPTIIPQQTSQEYIDKSPTVVATAKIQPIYNYYDKDFENVASNSKEQSLYNFYSLYYYLLANLEENVKKDFLNNNVLPLLKKYNNFTSNFLTEDINKLLSDFKKLNTQETSKKNIIVYPDALKIIDDLESRKAEQPFGIEVSFAPYPKKTLGTVLANTSEISDIEKFVITYQNPNNKLNDRNFIMELVYSNENQLTAKNFYVVPFINLNNWIENLEPISKFNSQQINESLIFTDKKKNNDSQFLKKIKKTLLQKKVSSLIKDNKRSFSDLLAGVPAYNEVILYEIKKYDSNSQLLQTILIPNTEELDFYNYFDTQVKYDTQYKYEVVAWTIIIGNKFKYFDRVEIPPNKKTLVQIKNNTSTDSEYFRWFRIAHIFSTLKNNVGGFSSLIDNYPELFGGAENISAGLSATTINFSRILFNSYTDQNYTNKEYQEILNKDNFEVLANNLINKVSQNFATVFTGLLVNSVSSADIVTYNISYQLFNKSTVQFPLDILGDNANINNKLPYYTQNFSIVDSEYVVTVLKLFETVGILKNLDINLINSLYVKYKEEIDVKKKDEIFVEISNYIKSIFVKDVFLFLNGGFFSKEEQVDLTVNPNYGLDKNSNYYPRFYTKKDNSNIISGQLQFGVLNETDIILAGLPYANSFDLVAVVSAPPPPPEISVIPYKNVDDRIKFFLSDSPFTYRDKPIYITDSDTAIFEKALKNEKIKNNDGKITFKGDEPAVAYIAYRLDKKPISYKDFAGSKEFLINPKGGGFDDTVEPNVKYYYTFRSFDAHNMVSNPSPIYEIEIVENSGAIYPIIKVYELEEEDVRSNSISIKEKFKINVNNEHILLSPKESIKSAVDITGLNKFGSKTPSLFGKKFKIRITSKSSKKKIDINLSFVKTLDTSLIKSVK